MERNELIGGLLKRIGNYSVHEWEHRIIVQKIIYILQKGLKENFGYNFKWYLRGPYSSDLADDFYKFKDTNTLSGAKYKDDAVDQRFKNFVNAIHDYNNNPDVLELTASLFYICNDGALGDESLLVKLKNLKPYMDDNVYQEAIALYHRIVNLEKIR